jgi:glyoxylase-like metal-dependent hydrolase (beta-lactamase superfamily II)
MPRKALLVAVALSLAALTSGSATLAAPPAQKGDQAPGYFRLKLGAMEVTALYDGPVFLESGLLVGATPEQVQAALARAFLKSTPGVQTAVNGFLIHTGTNLVLVDTGAGTAFGPDLGKLAANIRAAGYEPTQVDLVLLTHLHADHASGLLTPDGKAAFPNAVVRATKADADYWLSDAVMAQAPAPMKRFFELPRAAVAPYQAAGRFKTFNPGEALLPGVTVLDTSGHTAGHASYRFGTGEDAIVVLGDTVHSHSVQFGNPDVAMEFDSDKTKAIAARKRLFAEVAAKKEWAAGAHLPFPGIGHIRQDAPNVFAWVPAEYGPLPKP